MLYFILFLLAVWLIVTIAGAVLEGLFWLAVIGAVLFVATALWGWLQNKAKGRA